MRSPNDRETRVAHGAVSGGPSLKDRYRVPRPALQRIAGWCSLASTGALLFLIVSISRGTEGKGLRGFAQWFPVGTLYVLIALGVLLLVAIASAAYWARIESVSNGFQSRRKGGEKGP